MNDTAIEWTEKSWNPVTGCTPVSEGCCNCYARRMSHRLRGRCGYPADEPFRVTLHPERLREPIGLRKPQRIFVVSMGDLFHEDVPDSFIDQVFGVMAVAQQHTFQVLTKRPERMLRWFTQTASGATRETLVYEATEGSRWPGWPLPNVWLGVSVENQAAADERVPILLQTPAAVRFVSCEPLLSAIDLSHWLTCACDEYWPGQGHHPECPTQNLHWCIVGGETGPNARPMHPDWVRSLRDQAVAAGVPFLFKSWGEWAPLAMRDAYGAPEVLLAYDGEQSAGYCGWGRDNPTRRFAQMVRVGRKRAGYMLDGRTWDEYPMRCERPRNAGAVANE